MIVRKPVDLIRIHLSSGIGYSVSRPIRPNSKFDGQVKIQLSAPIDNAKLSLSLKGIERYRANGKPSGEIVERRLFDVPLQLWNPSIAGQGKGATTPFTESSSLDTIIIICMF